MYKKILTLLAIIVFIISCSKKATPQKEEIPSEPILPQFNITASILPETSGPISEQRKIEIYEKLRVEVIKSLSIICPAIKVVLSEKIGTLDEEFYPKGSVAVANLHNESLRVANDGCARAKNIARSFDNIVSGILNESDILDSVYSKILKAEENYYNMQEKNAELFLGTFFVTTITIDMLARIPSQTLVMMAAKNGSSPELGKRQEAEMRAYLKPVSAEMYGYFLESMEYVGTPQEDQAKRDAMAKLDVLFASLQEKIDQTAAKYIAMYAADDMIRKIESGYGKATAAPLIPYINEQYLRIFKMPEKEQEKALKKFAKDLERRVKANAK